MSRARAFAAGRAASTSGTRCGTAGTTTPLSGSNHPPDQPPEQPDCRRAQAPLGASSTMIDVDLSHGATHMDHDVQRQRQPDAEGVQLGQQSMRQLRRSPRGQQQTGRKRGELDEAAASWAADAQQPQQIRQKLCDQAPAPRLPLPLQLPTLCSRAASPAAQPHQPSTPAPLTPQAPSLEPGEDPCTPRVPSRGLARKQDAQQQATAGSQQAQPGEAEAGTSQEPLVQPALQVALPPLSSGELIKLLPTLPPLPAVPADPHKVKQANAILEAADAAEPEDVVPSTAELAGIAWDMGIDLHPAASAATPATLQQHQQQRQQPPLLSPWRQQQRQHQQEQQPASSGERQPGVTTPRQGSLWEDPLEAVLQLPGMLKGCPTD